jgi:uncharacterized protein
MLKTEKFEFVDKSSLEETSERRQPKLEFVDKALWFPVEKILVISDLHIGHEEALNAAGMFFPRIQFKQTMEDLKKIIEKAGKIEEIVICGDFKHEFGLISDQEWKESFDILEFLQEKAERVVLIKGNHDTILGPIAKRRGLEIKDFYILGDKCFLHGDRLFPDCLDKKIKMLILGHRHPAVVIADKYKQERFKCFLEGKWKGKRVIILPSFFPLIEGSDIVSVEENNRMFIPEKDLKDFRIYVVGDKIYKFGKLKKFGKLVR